VNRTFILRDPVSARACWNFISQNWAASAQARKPLSVTVALAKTKRSTDQNKRLWKLLNVISDGAWIDGRKFSPEAWHEQFKRQFIGVEELPQGGAVGISTASLSVAEFGDYMAKIERWAYEQFGIEFEEWS